MTTPWRVRYVASPLLPLALASEGCVSFAYSRFKPEPSSTGAMTECNDWPPLADLLITLGLTMGSGLLDFFAHGGSYQCSDAPANDPEYRSKHVAYYVPAMVGAASMTYGVVAYSSVRSGLRRSPPRDGSPIL
jgi:hypothetical protein